VSIRRLERKDGTRWEVRYRDGRRNRGRAFDRKKDAVAFESEDKRRKRLGALAELDAGEERLADFAQQWWRLHAKPNLAPSTLKSYASVWDLHVLPHLGDHELRQITPEVVANLRADLDAADVGPATVRRALRPSVGHAIGRPPEQGSRESGEGRRQAQTAPATGPTDYSRDCGADSSAACGGSAASGSLQ
jgi:hypothetical protein